jgi:hypothetical protein
MLELFSFHSTEHRVKTHTIFYQENQVLINTQAWKFMTNFFVSFFLWKRKVQFQI